jgi:serine/threonine-protein kinase
MAPRASVDFKPGQHFGNRYQIVEEIGRGGMGVVYKAIDKEISRVVALKIIRPELSSDEAMIEQFKRELILAREISHEHVIRIHDLGEERGIRYISMKYIEGTNLGDLLTATGRLSGERVISIAKQICSALDAAHRKGVIHRDLKPQNIMIDRGGDVHVMDFGIARSVESSEVPVAGTVSGTPSYMSPEQAQGKAGDARSDIYSLGCILYEMLTGRKVFESRTADGLMAQHIGEVPTPPSGLNPAVTPALDGLILKTLEKHPDRRFQSANDLCAALQGVPAADHTPVASSDTVSIHAPPAMETSIAVLPFRDMSPEKDQECVSIQEPECGYSENWGTAECRNRAGGERPQGGQAAPGNCAARKGGGWLSCLVRAL